MSDPTTVFMKGTLDFQNHSSLVFIHLEFSNPSHIGLVLWCTKELVAEDINKPEKCIWIKCVRSFILYIFAQYCAGQLSLICCPHRTSLDNFPVETEFYPAPPKCH